MTVPNLFRGSEECWGTGTLGENGFVVPTVEVAPEKQLQHGTKADRIMRNL
jgi:hypothetical protein